MHDGFDLLRCDSPNRDVLESALCIFEELRFIPTPKNAKSEEKLDQIASLQIPESIAQQREVCLLVICKAIQALCIMITSSGDSDMVKNSKDEQQLHKIRHWGEMVVKFAKLCKLEVHEELHRIWLDII